MTWRISVTEPLRCNCHTLRDEVSGWYQACEARLAVVEARARETAAATSRGLEVRREIISFAWRCVLSARALRLRIAPRLIEPLIERVR